MIGDGAKMVHSGEKLRIKADTWNALMRMLRTGSPSRSLGGVGGVGTGSSTIDFRNTILVRNDTAANIRRFTVLGIDGPIFDPEDGDRAAQAFDERVAIKGIAPEFGLPGRFVVAAEPMKIGALGKAFAFGVFPAIINVQTETARYTRCDSPGAPNEYLGLRADGGCVVLWREYGTIDGETGEEEPGQRRAILRFGDAITTLVRGTITAVTGESMAAVYDAESFDGQIEITGQTPIHRFFGTDANIVPAGVDTPCLIDLNPATGAATLLCAFAEKAQFTDCEGEGGGGVSEEQLNDAIEVLPIKRTVVRATTGNIDLSEPFESTMDGGSIEPGDRILVKNQSTASQNGIWIAPAAGAWTRAEDFDDWLKIPGALVHAEQGTTNGDKYFQCTSNAGGTLDTTAITFEQLGADEAPTVDVQTFAAGGTWNKPSWATSTTPVMAIVIGAGGGGAGGRGGSAGTTRRGGAGGGGGAIAERTFLAGDLGSTETVTIGAGGTAGTGGNNADGNPGGIGGTSSFGTHLSAFGGGGGYQGRNGTGAISGGSGGGTAGAGQVGSNLGSVLGGPPGPQHSVNTLPSDVTPSAIANAWGGGGGHAIQGVTQTTGCAEYGGGAGGGSSSASSAAGGSSLHGAGGGGAGGSIDTGNNNIAAAAGGASGSYTVGGGGAAGSTGGGAGTAGAAGTSIRSGSGGGGGGPNTGGTGGAGAAGGARGGGGGGGGGGTTVGGAGGAGGAGYCIVITYP